MANFFNKFKILTCANSLIDLNNININRLLTTKPKVRKSLNQVFDYNINNPQLLKKNKNQRKSAFIVSNNVSSVETSISSYLLDGANNIKKQLNNNSKSTKYFSEIGEQKQGQKALVYYVPKNIENKLIFDIVFGHFYFLSKNYNDIKKIEKFIFDLQNKFNKTILNLYNKDNNDFNDNSELSSSLRSKRDNIHYYYNNNDIYIEIQEKIYFFHKLEDIMAIYSIIIFYLVKNKNDTKAKEIYLIMIKQNIKCINYLDNLIDFKIYAKEKNNNNTNNRSLIRIYQSSIRIMLKIYSFLIKYGFYLHLSYYGNLFMKKYLHLSYNYYLFHIYMHKIKNSSIENENQFKHWFCSLNFFSAYFSIANYLPLKIPISLCNMILNIYNNIDDRYLELKDKNIIICTLYNKGIFLYMNGQSEEAINSLKEAKKRLFLYIEDYYTDEEVVPLRNSSNQGNLLVSKKNKKKNKSKNKGMSSIQKLFKTVHKTQLLIRSCSNKTLICNNYNFRKQIININKKFEPFFLSNTPFNITNFINNYLRIYNIKIEGTEDAIHQKPTFNKKLNKNENSLKDRRSFIQLTDIDKRRQQNIPNIFKSPFLIKTELLIAEIELDKKNYRSAYTYVNHALSIISVLRKIKNIYYLNKYKKEQKIINEFLNIIDNSNIKNYSDMSENKEDIEEDEEYDSIEQKEQFEREYELKEKIYLNKKLLKELEKFFLFFTTLSAYQIKLLNDTQPKTEKKNYLPILFQNQFKNCLSIKQIIAFENLHVMSLSRYMILKDPNKLILPNNLNISLLYFEKPELFSPRYFRLEQKNKDIEKQKNKEILHNNSYKIFQQILKSKNANIYMQNFLNNNYDLVMKIIEKSTIEEINKMIDNPSVLIKPVEKYKKKNPKKQKTKFFRHKSEVGLPNKNLLNKKLSLIDEEDIRLTLISNNLGKKHLKTSNSNKLFDYTNYNKINRVCTSSDDKQKFFKKKQKYKKKYQSTKESNIDLNESYKISINTSFD